jgi:hypothetical protein
LCAKLWTSEQVGNCGSVVGPVRKRPETKAYAQYGGIWLVLL